MGDTSKNAGKQGRKQNVQRENEIKANYTALISEPFIYKCSFKRLISSYSWTVNPCRCAHIMSPSFTAMNRKLGLYLWMRDFSFHTTTELSLKANQWLKGKALLSSPGECGHPQQPGVIRKSPHTAVGTSNFQLQKHQETTGSTANKNNNLSLDHSWVPVKCPLCPVCKCVKFKVDFPPLFKAYHGKLICRNNL